MSFGHWMNRTHKEIQDGYKAEEDKVELCSQREILIQMMEDMNRMMTDCDTVHPWTTYKKSLVKEYIGYEKLPVYNNNVNEEEWEMYKGVAPHED